MRIDEDSDWIDGFDTWEEVWPCLSDDWTRVVDLRQRVQVVRAVHGLEVTEVDRGLRARQRRTLHRLGFRPNPLNARVTSWEWDAEQAVRDTDSTDAPHPALWPWDRVEPPHRPRHDEMLRLRAVREEALRRQTERVLRRVLGSSPGDLVVVVYRDPQEWGWDEDDEDERSTG